MGRENLDIKKIVCAVLGIVLGAAAYAACLCGNVGLTQQGCVCLGVLIWAIVWWVAGVLPEYGTAILMVVAFAIFGGVDIGTATAAFSTSTWWLLIAAFSLGAGMKTSGLMKRIALGVINKFPNTFTAQVAGLMAAGTLLGPLVPSLSAKTAMLTPIAMSMGDAMGYPRQGKQQQGLFLAMLTGVRNIGPAIIAASPIGYALWGLMPADVQAQFDMLHWFLAALPWFIVVTILNYVAITLIYKPRKTGEQKAATPVLGGEDLGPMSRQEKQMLVIILATVVMWVAEPLHGIPSHIVALAAMVAMIACGIMSKKNLKNDIAWDSLIFIGCAVSLANVFSVAGIQTWIVDIAGPVFEQFGGNPYTFVLGIGIVTILVRFIIVSEMAYINIVMVFLIPLTMSLGINAWIAGIAVYAVVNPWFALYQNPVYLAAYYSVDGKMVRHVDMAKYCALYLAICLVGLAASVPYWQMLGLFG